MIYISKEPWEKEERPILTGTRFLFVSRRVREEVVEAEQLTAAFIQFALLWGKPKTASWIVQILKNAPFIMVLLSELPLASGSS